MLKYIRADLYRLYRRIPRLIMIALVLWVIGDMFKPSANEESTIIDLINLLEQVLKYVPVFIGFIEVIYVFGDDFAGKTSQIAIGIGVKRREIIIAKWLETMIVAAIDVVMFSVIVLLFCTIKTGPIPPSMMATAIAHIVVSVLSTGAYVSLVMPIMYAMQNITVAFLIYIVLAFGGFNKLISLLSNWDKIRRFHITSYTLTNCLNVFRSRMILGEFKYESVLGIVVYVAAGLGLTYAIYKRKELEF